MNMQHYMLPEDIGLEKTIQNGNIIFVKNVQIKFLNLSNHN